MKEFCLFEGRHPLPNNPKPLFTGFDFTKKVGIKSVNYPEFITTLEECEVCKLYVTGLTPALVEVLRMVYFYELSIILLHYDRETDSYWEQLFS